MDIEITKRSEIKMVDLRRIYFDKEDRVIEEYLEEGRLMASGTGVFYQVTRRQK